MLTVCHLAEKAQNINRNTKNYDHKRGITSTKLASQERSPTVASVASTMKHLRCRCLGGMTQYPQTQPSTISQTQQLQMACIQNFCTVQWFYAISANPNSTGRVYNVQYSTRILNTSEIASIACLHNFSGPALLS